VALGLGPRVIIIPADLYKSLESLIEGTPWSSVSEFAEAKLRDLLPHNPDYSPEEEALIRERLRKLGYIE